MPQPTLVGAWLNVVAAAMNLQDDGAPPLLCWMGNFSCGEATSPPNLRAKVQKRR